MVYYEKTLVLCHKPTKVGEEHYREMLEKKADEILFRHFHPFKYYFGKFVDLLRGRL